MLEKRTLNYLKKMVEADLPEVMKVELASYPYPWTLKNFEDCLNHKVYSCWVFMLDDVLSGYVVISIVADEAHILNICVAPSKQGNGWGRKLLQEAGWIATQRKSKDCFLEVRSSNNIGIKLYESEGYNQIGFRKNYYPADNGREDAIIMAKELV